MTARAGIGVKETSIFLEKHPQCFSSELASLGKSSWLLRVKHLKAQSFQQRSSVDTQKNYTLAAEAPQLFKVLCQLVERRDLVPAQKECC